MLISIKGYFQLFSIKSPLLLEQFPHYIIDIVGPSLAQDVSYTYSGDSNNESLVLVQLSSQVCL